MDRWKKVLKNPSYVTWKLAQKLTEVRDKITSTLRRGREAPADGVVMYHIGRSGSTVIGDLMKQHPDIRWEGEIVLAESWKSALPEFPDPKQPGPNLLPFLDQLKRDERKHDWLGFEIKFFHLDEFGIPLEQFIRDCNGTGYGHAIVLERTNYLRKIVSSLRAHQTKVWHQPASAKPVKQPVRIDCRSLVVDHETDTLEDTLARFRDQFADLRRQLQGSPHLWLTYEEDLENGPEIAYDKICAFLGVREFKASVRFGRTSPFPLSQLIDNFAEVQAAIGGTEFAWMLES